MSDIVNPADDRNHAPAIEPERYELFESGRYRFDLERRDFLRVLTAMGGGLLVVANLDHPLRLNAQETGRGGQSQGTPSELGAWIHLDRNGRATVFTGKVEIGQNIRTSLAQTVADELRTPLETVSMVMADTDLTPFDQGTFGSQTTPRMAPVLARAAATARELLIDRAAAEWHVPRETLTAEGGHVHASDGRSRTYGELVAAGDLKGTIAATTATLPKAKWTVRGRAPKKIDGVQFVTGGHAYTPDLTRPGMLHGRLIRPPAYGAKLLSLDASAAKAIAGVQVIVDGDFAGVVAPNGRTLARAMDALKPSWSAAPAQPGAATVYDHFRTTAVPDANGRSGGAQSEADLARVRGAAAMTLSESYRMPYIAHVPLEPRAALAEWGADGRVTIWTGTQRPFGVRTEVAQAFHLAEDRVRVIVPDMGSGYGGKHTGEQAVEAARLAKAAGQPVKVVYTRAEEFMWGYFRPGGVIDITASVDAAGRLLTWEFHNYNSGSAGLPTPYTVPNKTQAYHAADSPLRQGSYRGLAATANHYAREMHMDELARRLHLDPVEFRRAHIAEPRLRAVLDAVVDRVDWSRARPAGKAVGIACGTEKSSFVATAAEVTKTADGFTLDRLVVAFECGAIVNPDGLHNQVEGAVVQGLGGALFEAIDFSNGQLTNGTMRDYRVPRFKDVPAIDVMLIDRPDLASAGAGETPIVCVAPAIGSAVRQFGNVRPELPVRFVAG